MQKYLELRVKETDYVADAIATRISSQGRRGDRFHWPKLLRTQPTPPVNARHAKVRAKDTSEVRSDHRRLEGRRRVVPFLEYYGDDVVSDVPLSFHLPERTISEETQRGGGGEKMSLLYDSYETGTVFTPG